MIFSIVGMRDIGLWPLPPGLVIGTSIEVFQKLRSLSLKEGGDLE